MTARLPLLCSVPGVIVQSLCSLLASENLMIKDGLCTCPTSFRVLLVLWPQCFTVDFLLSQCLLFVIYHAGSLIELQAWQMVLGRPSHTMLRSFNPTRGLLTHYGTKWL